MLFEILKRVERKKEVYLALSVKPEIVIHTKSTVSNDPCLILQSLPLSYSYREARKCVLRPHRPTTAVLGTVPDSECEFDVPKSVHHHTIHMN